MSENKIDYCRAKRSDETPAEFLQRVVQNLGYEEGSLLDQMPSVDALLDYYGVFCTDYGTDYWEGVLECIADGDSPDKANDFIARWNLGDGWKQSVLLAIESRDKS